MKYMEKTTFLRKKYPLFIYKDYSYKVVGNSLELVFDFKVEPDIYFKPRIIIKNISKARVKKIGGKVLDNFVFHLGLALVIFLMGFSY